MLLMIQWIGVFACVCICKKGKGCYVSNVQIIHDDSIAYKTVSWKKSTSCSQTQKLMCSCVSIQLENGYNLYTSNRRANENCEHDQGITRFESLFFYIVLKMNVFRHFREDLWICETKMERKIIRCVRWDTLYKILKCMKICIVSLSLPIKIRERCAHKIFNRCYVFVQLCWYDYVKMRDI